MLFIDFSSAFSPITTTAVWLGELCFVSGLAGLQLAQTHWTLQACVLSPLLFTLLTHVPIAQIMSSSLLMILQWGLEPKVDKTTRWSPLKISGLTISLPPSQENPAVTSVPPEDEENKSRDHSHQLSHCSLTAASSTPSSPYLSAPETLFLYNSLQWSMFQII